ncbi:MAG: hypothetical protein K1X87_10400 [Dehalococcoidia bacterium]|nr:hypothetical protein [Dehalococcoidia bacterium]
MAAGLVSIFLGVGFGLPGVAGARHFARTGDVWTFLGFPTYGDGPFEHLGIPTSTALLVAFVAVCVAEVAVGVLLVMGRPLARTLGFGLLPIELVFWVGFALPVGPPLGLLRTILLVISMRAR